MTAYAFFVQTCREEHKKKHPDENVIFAAFSKKCAERWNVSKYIHTMHILCPKGEQRYLQLLRHQHFTKIIQL
jgi:high mobility group protein B1